jgi:SAM-dependent methyltransferase
MPKLATRLPHPRHASRDTLAPIVIVQDLPGWLLERLRCPAHGTALTREADALICACGERFPIVGGVPVLLRADVVHTRPDVAARSIALDRLALHDQALPDDVVVDPYVANVLVGSNGNLYRRVGALNRYPIPILPVVPVRDGEILLDEGCHWGRWCLAAARAGFRPVGVDVSLDHVLTAVRVARRLGVPAWFMVADARHLPLAPASIDVVFSYSVWQHFAPEDAREAMADASRVLRPGGRAVVQMANAFGLRNLYQQARRGFRRGRHFDVRYHNPVRLQGSFARTIGPAAARVDGFFSLNPQPGDRALLPASARAVVTVSEALRRVSRAVPPLRWLADSLMFTAVKRQ